MKFFYDINSDRYVVAYQVGQGIIENITTVSDDTYLFLLDIPIEVLKKSLENVQRQMEKLVNWREEGAKGGEIYGHRASWVKTTDTKRLPTLKLTSLNKVQYQVKAYMDEALKEFGDSNLKEAWGELSPLVMDSLD